MRFAVNIPNFGDFADPRLVADLAREVTTLDRLTGGRMILGVGLGAPLDDEYGSFGESTDPKLLAAKLDEGLFGLNELWSGNPVTFRGHHVVVDDVAFAPVPVQRPRVPIWVGGNWPARPPSGSTSSSPVAARRKPPPKPSARWPKPARPGGRNAPGTRTWNGPSRCSGE